ncbi:complex I NDUFA9 subunit family protein [Halovulum dunhuangense]|uniref:Complex I NDUFA9 subunit family protein n=1 Tax=Halovulum dunhuangense TaxID=1505036 RepID=A0A849KXN9_9RHOB|nr:complex I NDUFA9 subunit family protein [Halovulum dunhuangense]NNU79387.1 complex I NDUFA9 subunit family protein [Halovulum dunhuangense]
MIPQSPIVTIFGGSGFVGRYIARRMARAGWRVRVAVRRPNEALFVRTYGVVGQVEPVLANIRDDASVAAAIAGADAVVYSVGILAPSGKQTFEAVQAEGAGRVARLAAEAGVTRFVHISAIGADANSPSRYARTKAEGEANVLAHQPDAVILRPSIVFGTEDQFFNRFAAMARISPVIPVIGPDTRFQPVFVDDIAAAAEKALVEGVAPGVYELGGPEIATFRGLMDRMLGVIRRRRLVLAVPFGIAKFQGRVFDILSRASGGLIPAPVTYDQVLLLERDNVVSPDARGFGDLGLSPTAMNSELADYLTPYRPYGQYARITDSAKDLRG